MIAFTTTKDYISDEKKCLYLYVNISSRHHYLLIQQKQSLAESNIIHLESCSAAEETKNHMKTVVSLYSSDVYYLSPPCGSNFHFYSQTNYFLFP